ncbi:cytochrome P450 [Ceratobasidium sp. AG-I]|nr:cytochrome P450 [Ceratobasidium sp. AG-I]
MTYLEFSYNPSFRGMLESLKSPYGIVVLFIICLLLKIYVQRRSDSLTPPTIPGHWFFKNQLLLQAPWRGILLAETYKPQYGDVIYLSTPFKANVVLNSLEMVSEVLEKHSAMTSDRPRNVMLNELAGLNRSVAFRNHDERHRKSRRVMASALHPAAARSYADLHTANSAFFLNNIMSRLRGDIRTGASREGGENRISDGNGQGDCEALVASIRDTIGRFIMRMTYGHVVRENDLFLAIANEVVFFITVGFARHYWVNDFPILQYIPEWFPGASFRREAQFRNDQRSYATEETFRPVVRDVHQGTIERSSYSSKLLELKGGINASEEDVELVKWTASSMFTAGSTTTTALVYTFIFGMSIRPSIAARVQEEIDAQIGRDRLPELHDRDVLPYTDAVLQEVIRFYPVFPLGLEHCATEDMKVRGYTIRKGTTIEANIWAIMRDPKSYPNPHVFDPTRFLTPTPNPDPRRFLFGFGRRVCPGQHVANNGAFTLAAAFMSVFKVVAGDDTMKEVEKCGREVWRMFTPFGPFEPMPFKCTITPRDEAAVTILETCKEMSANN